MPGLATTCYFTPAFTPVDINAAARTGIRVPITGFSWATCVLYNGDVAAVVTYTFQRYTAATAGSTEIWDVLSTDATKSMIWSKESTTEALTLTVDPWTRIAATSTSTTATTSGSSGVRIVEFDLADINTAAANVNTHVGVDTDAPGAASICWGLWILSGARYAHAAMSATLP